MTPEELCAYTLKSVNEKLTKSKPIKKEIPGYNGVFKLEFNIRRYFLTIVSDRGYLDLYVYLKGKSIKLMVNYPEIANKQTTIKNIDFIIEFLYQHKDEIFPEE